MEQTSDSGGGNLSRAKLTVKVHAGPDCTTFYIGVIKPPRYPDPIRTPNAPIPDVQTGCIAGQVIDDNHNALPGWIVQIKPADAETPVLQTTSDGLGYIRFPGLTPGRWTVWQTMPDGWTQVTDGTFDVTVARDPACTNIRFKNRVIAGNGAAQ